jgi:hypothetical protein
MTRISIFYRIIFIRRTESKMKYKPVKLCAVFLLGIGLTSLHAQESIPTSGGDVSGNGGSVSFSVGQLVYITNTGTDGSAAQGVQQPFEISVISEFEEAKRISVQCSVYPNPTKDYLTLKIENVVLTTLIFSLYDSNGKLLESKKIEDEETNLVLGNLIPGDYFLKVTDDNKEVKSFKIIKH